MAVLADVTGRATACRRPRLLAGMLALLAGCGLTASGAQPIVSSEYAVKAAFLYNFAKFIEWPAGALPGPRGPVAFCILGEDPFGGELEQTVAGKMVQGRPVVVLHTEHLDGLARCHILFVGASERSRFDQILAAVARRPVLTVGEDEQFRQAGGIINFVLRQNRVRFQIDRRAAERAGLRISSQLLELAEAVSPGGSAGKGRE
jgi:YfiR/HmsC-like